MRYRQTLLALAGRLLIIGALLIGAPTALGMKGRISHEPRRSGVFLDPFENAPVKAIRTTAADSAPILLDESVRSGLFVDPSSATLFLDPAAIVRSGWFLEPLAHASAPVLLDEGDDVAATSAFHGVGPNVAEKICALTMLVNSEVCERAYGSFAAASRTLNSLTPRVEAAPSRARLQTPASAARATAPARASRDQAVSMPRIPELPTPRSAAPAAYRIKPIFETQVCGLENGANAVMEEGILERRALSAVAGVEYALVRNGATVHLLLARSGVSLEHFVGRCVGILGVPLQAGSCASPVLDVSMVTLRE
jgi:hypothetical protein